MLKNQINGLSAPQLRIILIVSMGLMLALAAGAFWYFRSGLVEYAQQVQKDNAKAKISSSDINKLKALKQELEDNKVAVTRTKNIVADSQYYQYQNQIIDDITAYAKKANVTLGGFIFNSETAAGATGGAATTTTPAPAGLKTMSVSVTIKSPVDFKALMQFIHYIEVNLTKMQISSISLAQVGPGDPNVTANQVTLEVYTR